MKKAEKGKASIKLTDATSLGDVYRAYLQDKVRTCILPACNACMWHARFVDMPM